MIALCKIASKRNGQGRQKRHRCSWSDGRFRQVPLFKTYSAPADLYPQSGSWRANIQSIYETFGCPRKWLVSRKCNDALEVFRLGEKIEGLNFFDRVPTVD